MNSQREAFEKQYCENSGITVSEYRKEYVTLPCQCPEEDCPGWAVVRATPLSIKTHVDLYAPDWQAATEQGVGEVHWSAKNPGLADQYRAEALRCRNFLGFSADSENVSPSDLGKAIIDLTGSAKPAGGGVPDENELWSVLEAATEAMNRKALPVAYISLAWNGGAEFITKRRVQAQLATQQPPEQDTPE